MSPNPAGFLSHLQKHGYHPRSDKHSNALAEAIVADLYAHCPKIRQRMADAQLVYALNYTTYAGTADSNIDLVLGEPALATSPEPQAGPVRGKPSSIQIAIEIKSIMTEHRKAVKNRKRDFEGLHEHVHNYNRNAVAAGVFVINAASVFQSPLRPEPSQHANPDALVKHCIDELRSVSVRGGTTGYGLEAKAAIVVSMDNLHHANATYVSRAPAPQMGDPLHYDGFIRSICDHFTRRF